MENVSRMSEQMLDALEAKYKADVLLAQSNILVYIHNPVGIGDHPDVVAAIDNQVGALAQAEEKLTSLQSFRQRIN